MTTHLKSMLAASAVLAIAAVTGATAHGYTLERLTPAHDQGVLTVAAGTTANWRCIDHCHGARGSSRVGPIVRTPQFVGATRGQGRTKINCDVVVC
jgi:hypothetical protein